MTGTNDFIGDYIAIGPGTCRFRGKGQLCHPVFACEACEGTVAPLYHSPRFDGATVSIVHACEHEIRDWSPDAPADLSRALVIDWPAELTP